MRKQSPGNRRLVGIVHKSLNEPRTETPHTLRLLETHYGFFNHKELVVSRTTIQWGSAMIPGRITIRFPTLASLNQHCKSERLF